MNAWYVAKTGNHQHQSRVFESLGYWLRMLRANRKDRIARFNVRWFMEWAHQNANR